MADWAQLPAELNLSFMAGDTVDFTVELHEQVETPPGSGHYEQGDPIDLTDCSAAAQIRQTTASATVAATFTVVNNDTLGTDGQIELNLSTADSTVLGPLAKLVWDLQVTYSDGVVRTEVGGTVLVSADVTKLG